MNKRIVKLWSLFVLTLSAVVLLLLRGGAFEKTRNTARVRVPLTHTVYVWQRQWSDDVTQGVMNIAEHIHGYSILAAEVSWDGEAPKIVRAVYDADCFDDMNRCVALVIRIGPFAGQFSSESRAVAELSTLVLNVLREAAEKGVQVSELQLDFDCAESKLDGYCQFIQALRKVTRQTPLTITALPCWLKRSSFKRLARVVDGYVLQVHSLEPPRSPDHPMVLCNVQQAGKWVDQAAAIGVPFSVALPTYGYLVAFDRAGKFLGLSAEGELVQWGPEVIVKRVNSDWKTISALAESWKARPPENMRGISWYRLPVQGDQLNWSLTALVAAIEGRELPEQSFVSFDYKAGGLVDLYLNNMVSRDVLPPSRFKVCWGTGLLLACDGLSGYSCTMGAENSVEFVLTEDARTILSAPATLYCAGWLKFDRDVEVYVDVY
ncbi:MAG: DUF3142 domain-containing protein [Kiritimatiellae bacterium]|nr:DUF3142 domain-containing protein [Kiritimatiellia bacterium]